MCVGGWVAVVALMCSAPAHAQITNAAGVRVDPQGVLRSQAVADPGLSAEQRKAAVAALPGNLQKRVPLRKVALSRLEAAAAQHAADGRGMPDEIEKLAGLTRVQYVFVYPAEGDTPGEIVRAGCGASKPAARPSCSRISPSRFAPSLRASHRIGSLAAPSIPRRTALPRCRSFSARRAA
jgi:hypothetical protein